MQSFHSLFFIIDINEGKLLVLTTSWVLSYIFWRFGICDKSVNDNCLELLWWRSL